MAAASERGNVLSAGDPLNSAERLRMTSSAGTQTRNSSAPSTNVPGVVIAFGRLIEPADERCTPRRPTSRWPDSRRRRAVIPVRPASSAGCRAVRLGVPARGAQTTLTTTLTKVLTKRSPGALTTRACAANDHRPRLTFRRGTQFQVWTMLHAPGSGRISWRAAVTDR